ncbi:MAG: hypothetical protein RR314_00900 [Oscillospiraceae bacterium]
MGRNEKRILLIVLALLAVVVGLYVLQGATAGREARVYALSVILCGADDNFEKGIESAALEKNADMHTVIVEQGDKKAQTAALERELKNGAEAVILYGFDSGALCEWSEGNVASAPIVYVGAEAPAIRGLITITAEPSALAEVLVARMAHDSLTRDAVLTGESGPARDALLSALEGAGFSVTEMQPEKAALPRKALCVCTEPATAELVCSLASEGSFIYALGFRPALREPLETGKIRALAVSSGYDAGYLAVNSAVSKASGGRPVNELLAPYIADAENMYERPLSSVLFPIA